VSKPSVRRPSPALVVACIALLVALGGTGYATVLNVPRNSVGPLHLKRNAVTSSRIAPNAVQTAHVRNGSLLAEDFGAGQLPSGPKGDTGPPGLTWGDVRGPGTGGGTYKPLGQSLVLPTDVGRPGSELKFFVFGRVGLTLRCSAAANCGASYVLLVNGAFVPTAYLSFSGTAGATTPEQHGSAFGIVTVRSVGPGGGVGTKVTRLSWGSVTGSGVVGSTVAPTVGAIQLGS
jgi:hypothetical protein